MQPSAALTPAPASAVQVASVPEVNPGLDSGQAPPVVPRLRLRLAVRGAVQGVGFRPFVHRLALELSLTGWVNNSLQGVFIEVEGPRDPLEQFLLRLEAEKPPRSSIQSLEASWLDAFGYESFEIRPSETAGPKTALVLPDIATCPDCLRELFDPANRRFQYPFTNCTNCGPRFSIIEALPYDRASTSMKSFPMCPQCRAEYVDPANRRFHAQPNACPVCGPRLELWEGTPVAAPSSVRKPGEAAEIRPGPVPGVDPLPAAAAALRSGQIVAVKGLGGFQLLVAAHDEAAVLRLRERKHRREKPLALMFPTLESVRAACEVSPLEERLLRSPEAPIVLLRRLGRRPPRAQDAIAPGNPCLGVMLPGNPLLHLLLAELGFPVVATSGNLSEEPICTDELEALERLGGIADFFLVHNRPIVRHVDDSIVRVMLGREMVLRRARGYAPLPILLAPSLAGRKAPIVLAVGAHLKNTVALSVGNQVFLSQHIGDLETEAANTAFRRVIADFEKLYDVHPDVIAADLHPDYVSTKFAFARPPRHEPAAVGAPHARHLIQVQHHSAHVLACMAENQLEPPALGVCWDGTGCGPDGTIWGGEFLLVTEGTVERIAHLRPFRLPGGEKAVKEPRRAALGILQEIFGNGAFQRTHSPPVTAFSEPELATLQTMLQRGLGSPVTSSAGRLFDAVASLTNLRQQNHFEGQAAMDLEFALEGVETGEFYDLPLGTHDHPAVLDWAPMIEAILWDMENGVAAGEISAKFHNALAEAVVAVARHAGESCLVLSGGCFQNRYLTERTVLRLEAEGFRPYWHQRVPANDGGIALGQVVAALRQRA